MNCSTYVSIYPHPFLYILVGFYIPFFPLNHIKSHYSYHQWDVRGFNAAIMADKYWESHSLLNGLFDGAHFHVADKIQWYIQYPIVLVDIPFVSH